MNVLFVIANEINTLLKKTSAFQIASKATTSDVQQMRATKAKNQRQMKNKRMVEPIFGKCSQRKAEVKVLIPEKIEFKAKSVKQKTMMSLLYCKVYSPR